MSINNVHTAAGGLHALLQVIYEVSTDIQYLRPDGTRDETAERLSHLIILARNEAERMDQAIEAYIHRGKAGAP